jgi:hypothetical protein
VSGRFVGRVGELNGYLGVPMGGLVLFTAVRWWRSPVAKVASVTGLLLLVLSMGERLHLNGRILDVDLPWAAMRSLPLIESAIPTRLMLIANLFVLRPAAGQLRRPGPAVGRRWPGGGHGPGRGGPGDALPRVPLHAEPPAATVVLTGPGVRRIPRAVLPWWRRSPPPRRPGR